MVAGVNQVNSAGVPAMATTTKQPTVPSSPEDWAAAAHKAVLDRRLGIERDPRSLRGLTIELECDSAGRLTEARAFVQRHLTVSQALGLRR